MKRIFYVFIFFLFIFILPCFSLTHAQQNNLQVPEEKFYTGNVVKIVRQGQRNISDRKTSFQILQIRLDDGPQKNQIITISYGLDTSIVSTQLLHEGDKVILADMKNSSGKSSYIIFDIYRLPSMMIVFIIFFIAVLIIAGWKGLGSLFGLGISLAVILIYMVPQILSGANPLQVSIIASIIILFLTTYLAHGISKQTTVALFSTFISLMLTVGISTFFVHITHLTGLNDETVSLLFGPTSKVNFQGLLLGGIIIGTLGALNDITTTQSATIFSLAEYTEKPAFKNLFIDGFKVGREHIVSMVNTLVLAYVGSALALLLFVVLNPQGIPFWVLINNEDISGEIIRAISGSLGLILVVPIVTFLAAILNDRKVKQFFIDVWYSLFG